MTQAMWFAFLLRDDVRAGAPIDDEEAQRAFVAWWLLYGQSEYPAIWTWHAAQAAVAMERCGRLPRLLRLLHAARGDLAAAFPLDDAESIGRFLCWYRLHGPAELPAAPELAAAERAETLAPGADGVPRIAAALHAARQDLRATFDLATPGGRQGLAAWFAAEGAATLPAPHAPHPPAPDLARRPHAGTLHGVTLAGFAQAQSGIGEDVRMLAAALEAAGIAHEILAVPPPAHVGAGETALADRLVATPRFDCVVFCMMPFDTAGLLLAAGAELFHGRKLIGAWPWELPRISPEWSGAGGLVDEIWAPSAFAAAAFASLPVPVHCLPPAIALPPPALVARDAFGLPDDAFVFVFPFDPASYVARKNPLAAVRAFQRAFAWTDRRVRLLLRVNGTLAGSGAAAALAQAIDGDPRIILHEGRLTRSRALGLLRVCDCLVSPHRSEGLGRNIAEAILLGVPVLATGFGGCTDFLTEDEMLPWARREVAAGDYPFAAGQYWAEPDSEALAARMRALASAPRDPARLAARAAALAETYAPAAAGRRYAARLAALGLV